MADFSGTRRDVLRRGAAAVGASTMVGNAGCLGILGGSDYSDWLPEPGAIDSGDHYGVNALNLQSLSENEDELESWNLADFEDRWAPADVDWEDVELYLRFGGLAVVEADFEQSEVVSAYEDEDYSEAGEHEGYVLMLGPEERRMTGVGEDALVIAGGGESGAVEDPEDAIETVLDAKNGDEDRYVDDTDDFGELADELDVGDVVTGVTHEPTEESAPERGRFENQVAYGRRWNVEGETTKGKWVLVFDEADDVDVGDVEEWVDASQDGADGAFTDWEDVEVSENGRTAVIEGTAAVAEGDLVGNADRSGTVGGGGYSSWLPEPGAIGDSDHYQYTKLNLQGLAEDEDEFDDGTDFEAFEDTWAPADVNWEDVSMLLRFNGISVIQAAFDPEDIFEDFRDEDYGDAGEYEGYTLMLGPDETSMGAVGDGTIVLVGIGFTGGVEDPQDIIEDVIDTANGDGDRYEGDSEDFSEMAGGLGDSDIVSGSTMEPADETVAERGQFENQVAEGETLDVNGETTDGTWVLVFESEDDVDTGDVEDWVDANQDDGGEFETWDDVEVNASGRTVVVEATADTDAI